jgi:phosphate uptake regulator
MELTEVRKLLPRGSFSLDVTIPKWWAEGHDLKRGSEVKMTVTPERIVIEPIKELGSVSK